MFDARQYVFINGWHSRFMKIIDVLKCFAAHDLARSHGVFYAASFLQEHSLPVDIAVEFLTSQREKLFLKYRCVPAEGDGNEPKRSGHQAAGGDDSRSCLREDVHRKASVFHRQSDGRYREICCVEKHRSPPLSK